MSGSSGEEQQLDLSAFSEEESTTTPEEPTEEFPCPWDGCERRFDTRRGVGIHHKSVHGESIGGPHVEVNCAWCGESKMVYPGRAERSDNHFCDKECKGQYRRNRPKQEHYNWGGGKVEVSCEHCSETKRVYPSRVENRDYFFCDDDCKGSWISDNQLGVDHPRWVERIEVRCCWCGGSKLMTPARASVSDRHFCSIECRGGWLSENFSGEHHPMWDGGNVVVECAYCGSEKEIQASQSERADRNFCDPSCNAKWTSENRSGRNHPLWKGGISFYQYMRRIIGPRTWAMTKNEFHGLENHSCVAEDCSWTPTESDGKAHIHHIIPVLNGGTNDLDLLIPLCPQCHKTAEHYTRNKLDDVIPDVYTDYSRDELPDGRVPSDVFRKLCNGVRGSQEILRQIGSE